MAVTTFVQFIDLLTYLREKRVPHLVEGTSYVEMPCPSLKDVTYLRWEAKLPYLQIIQPVVRDVPLGRDAQIWSAVCRVNDADALGGFALEAQRRFIYVRRTLPVYEEGLPSSWFERELAAVIHSATERRLPFKRVADGGPAADVLAN